MPRNVGVVGVGWTGWRVWNYDRLFGATTTTTTRWRRRRSSKSKSYSERNKYVYGSETFVIQIKYKRHYSFYLRYRPNRPHDGNRRTNKPALCAWHSTTNFTSYASKQYLLLNFLVSFLLFKLFFFFLLKKKFNLDLCTLIWFGLILLARLGLPAVYFEFILFYSQAICLAWTAKGVRWSGGSGMGCHWAARGGVTGKII